MESFILQKPIFGAFVHYLIREFIKRQFLNRWSDCVEEIILDNSKWETAGISIKVYMKKEVWSKDFIAELEEYLKRNGLNITLQVEMNPFAKLSY